MESTNGGWRPWTGYVPTKEEMQEHDGSKENVPRVHPNGWYMLEYPSGTVEVCHIREVRFLDHLRLEVWYSDEDGPVYDHGFYSPRMRPISRDKALAWFTKNGRRPPVIASEEPVSREVSV